MEIVKGCVVKAKAGRDKDVFFVVLDVDGSYAMICDGKRRTLEKPKRKKYKHLSATKSVLEIGLLNSNNAIRKALNSFNDN